VILLGGRGGDAPADDFASQGSSAGPVSMPRSARPAPARAQAAAEPAMDQGISDDDVPF
jgi:hypothetical protein